MRTRNKILEDYNERKLAWKNKIKLEPSPWKRFWKWVWYIAVFPWVWAFYNLRDWRTVVVFILSFIVCSSEVWVPYLLGLILDNNWLIGVGTACWLFWLGPGTPFMVVCIAVTIGVKTLWNRMKKKTN